MSDHMCHNCIFSYRTMPVLQAIVMQSMFIHNCSLEHPTVDR